MTMFLLLAALLCLAVAAALVIPLVRTAPGSAPPSTRAALGEAVLLIGGSGALYAPWSSWKWSRPPPADSPAGMVARLARQLEHDPQNVEGWLMLGHSYTVLQEYPLAVRAYERADRLTHGNNVDALVGEAQA